MDPISIALSVAGLGMSIFGGFGSASATKEAAQYSQQEAAVSQDEARQQQGINDLKQQQMELEARRTQIENIRNAQRAAAVGLNNATNQGAQFGSGIQGAEGGIFSNALFNMQGVNQAVEIGRGINTFNKNISADRITMAGLEGKIASAKGAAADDAAWASLGGALMKAAPVAGQIGKGFSPNFNFLFGGGSPSGYGTGK